MEGNITVEPMTLRKACETHGLYPAVGWYMIKNRCTYGEAVGFVGEAAAREVLRPVKVAGTYEDNLLAVVVDSDNNIICVGYTTSEERDDKDALIIKFDSDLNIITRKRRCGRDIAQLTHVELNGLHGGVICVGETKSTSYRNLVVIAFDVDFNKIARIDLDSLGVDNTK